MKLEQLLRAAPFSGTRVKPFDGTRKYLSTGDLQDASRRFVDITFKGKPSRADIVVGEGDVLFARMKGTRKVLLVSKELAGTIVSTGFAVLRPSEDCYPAYLATYLGTDHFERQKDKYCSGAIQPAITNGGIENLEIPLPPLDEQIRIAHLLGKVERLIAQRKQHLQQLDDLLKSVFLEMFGDPVRNEKGWETRVLPELCTKITDGEHLNPQFAPSGMPMVMAGNVLDHTVNLRDTKFVEYGLGEFFRRKCDPEPSDILLVSRGATIGRLCRVDTSEVFCLMGSVILIKPIHRVVNSNFLVAQLKHPALYWKLFRSSGSSAQQAIYLKDVKRLVCIRPPMELQLKFSDFSERVESTKGSYRRALSELEALYGALSQQAFKGELDLSRVALSAAPIEGEKPLAAAVPALITAPVIELPENDLLLPALQDRAQLAPLLRFWLEAYRTQLGSAAFSLERFIAVAQTRLDELHPNNDFEWAASDYESIKTWVFEALAVGALTQAFDDDGNRIELKTVAEQGLA